MPLYCNAKDPHDQKNHVIYKIKCLGCSCCYIGKTERCLITRITEHATKQNLGLNMSLKHVRHTYIYTYIIHTYIHTYVYKFIFYIYIYIYIYV